MTGDTVETKYLIVGAGPAGASLACFLASHGLKGIMISASMGTSDTPRAHITNAAAIECLRDIGLEDEIVKVGQGGENIEHVRWAHSMSGEEYARLHAFGTGPDRKGEYESASPCRHFDLPQSLLEPILVRYATNHGFNVRFQTTLVSFFEQETTTAEKHIMATVRDSLSKTEYKIRTKYLFGADGGRSRVATQLGIPLLSAYNGDDRVMINTVVGTDLSHLMEYRKGDLHWLLQQQQPEEEGDSDLLPMCIVRMVKPWHEWMFTLVAGPSFNPRAVTKEYYLPHIKRFIGDDSTIQAEVLHATYWNINETVAETYSSGGNIFILGDAAHRHPPAAGLGSNTCIQDAFNLAWKVAYVEQKLAGPSLLDTYSAERQPVGQGVVKRANEAMRGQFPLFAALGFGPPAPGSLAEEGDGSASSPGGGGGGGGEVVLHGSGGGRRRVVRASMIRDALESVKHEFNGLGMEMNQLYTGAGIYVTDEEEPFKLTGEAEKNAILHHQPSTYPGRRLPHAWLNKAIPQKPISTIDLAGGGGFTLFTGHGGEAWKEAAEAVGKELDVMIRAYSIGFRQDWEDVYFVWDQVRGVEESGAVLVRPDRFVAWRAKRAEESGKPGCQEKLGTVMRAILGV
ncbi:FAD binding domain-containing protein [Apodospora peruviana]|uniref:FAD binding domain-containing protein n=1 Tax=Apodospora peruviana TaxID=516989 RepID=A0AAE0HXQ8_9PEZI|nr:FAD binding domain-containing protein [Apodospora peruviana]